MKLVPGTKTVDGVLSAFRKTIADLTTISEEQSKRELKLRDQADKLSLDADAAALEMKRANEVKAKLEAFIS